MIGLLLSLALLSPSGYQTLQVEGWTVNVASDAYADSRWTPAKERLTQNLKDIKKAVPAHALPSLQKVKLWFERESPHNQGAAYHPSEKWLRDNNRNPDYAESIEFGNLTNFVAWQDHNQPWMVMHELAHAYHHQVLRHPAYIKEAYEAAKAGGKYDSVLLGPKHEKARHYGMNNEMEFFAELTESYFGRNDFQPFVRSEFKDFDPAAYEMIERAWQVDRFAPK